MGDQVGVGLRGRIGDMMELEELEGRGSSKVGAGGGGGDGD